MITTPWTKFFYEYLLEDEQELNVGEMLTVYFGIPNMFITLWFGFVYVTSSKEHLRSLVRVHELNEITPNGGKDRSAT
jgi:hypothetical protein